MDIIQKMWKITIASIYGIGTLSTLILLLIIVLKIDIVPFPDSMLPMRLYEVASIWLAIASIPMLMINILFYISYKNLKTSHKKRNTILIYTPTIICFVTLFYWIVDNRSVGICYICLIGVKFIAKNKDYRSLRTFNGKKRGRKEYDRVVEV